MSIFTITVFEKLHFFALTIKILKNTEKVQKQECFVKKHISPLGGISLPKGDLL